VAAVTSRGCVRLRPCAPFSPQIAAKIGAIPGCHMRSGCLRVAFLMLWVTGAASAQTPIEGTVRDSSGRAVPGASVVLQHEDGRTVATALDRKSTRLNSSHITISYAVFCLKKKTTLPQARKR